MGHDLIKIVDGNASFSFRFNYGMVES